MRRIKTANLVTFLPTLTICLMFLAFPDAAFAQRGVFARIEWYGVYTTEKSQEIADPNSPTGKRFTVTPVPPPTNSDRIPGRDDLRFGLSYMLSASAQKRVTVKEVYVFPAGGMPDSVTHTARSDYATVDQADVGVSRLMGWSFLSAAPERIVFGDWRFQVWQGDQLLLEKTFTVYKP